MVYVVTVVYSIINRRSIVENCTNPEEAQNPDNEGKQSTDSGNDTRRKKTYLEALKGDFLSNRYEGNNNDGNELGAH